jgi:hypothetical protein
MASIPQRNKSTCDCDAQTWAHRIRLPASSRRSHGRCKTPLSGLPSASKESRCPSLPPIAAPLGARLRRVLPPQRLNLYEIGSDGGQVGRSCPLLQLEEWDKDKTYKEDPPECLRYHLGVNLTLNGKSVLKDTKINLALAPTLY